MDGNERTDPEDFQKMQECHPAELFRCMDDTKAGLGAVLRILYTAKEPVTAGRSVKRWNQYGEGSGSAEKTRSKRADYKRA